MRFSTYTYCCCRKTSLSTVLFSRRSWLDLFGKKSTPTKQNDLIFFLSQCSAVFPQVHTRRQITLSHHRTGGSILRAEGLLNVDEAKQGRFADQPHALARRHTRLALQRSQEPQRAEGGPGWEVAGVGGPGEDAGVGQEDERTRGAPQPSHGGVQWRKWCFGGAKVLQGAGMKHPGSVML